MIFLIVLEGVFVRTALIEASYHEFVDEPLAYEIFLYCSDLGITFGAFSVTRCTWLTKCMSAWVEPEWVSHELFALWTFEMDRDFFIDELVVDSLCLHFLCYWLNFSFFGGRLAATFFRAWLLHLYFLIIEKRYDENHASLLA